MTDDPKTTPDPRLTATQLDRVDLLEAQVFDERCVRLEAQMETLRLKHAELAGQLQVAQAEKQQVLARVKVTYGLGDDDSLNLTTGVLTRAAPQQGAGQVLPLVPPPAANNKPALAAVPPPPADEPSAN